MSSRGRILGLALGAALALAGAEAIAAGGHSHDGHATGAIELNLDNGKKWQIDAPLQKGMEEIRRSLAASLDKIHHGKASNAEFTALADSVEQQVDYITQNCKLPEQADAELHVVIGQVLDGVETMRKGVDRRAGAVKLVEALDAYGEYFDHPGWQKLTH
jgi:hypothetical protein